MPKFRLEAVVGMTDSDTAWLIGTTDNGSVRLRASVPVQVAMLVAATATVFGPIEFDIPEDAIESVEEIDPEA